MKINYEAVAMPENWQVDKIGNRLKLNYGKSQSSVRSKNGTVPVYGTGGIIEYATRSLCPGDSVLVGRKGTLDKPIYIEDSFWPVDTTYYTADFDGSSRWFYYLAQTLDLAGLSEATGVPSLSRETFYRLIAPFPPKCEQFKIAEVLATIDRVIKQTETLIAKRKRVRTGLVQDLLTRGIDEKGILRDPTTHEFQPSPLGPIPIEWNVRRLEQILTFPTGQADPRFQPYSEWPLLAPDHVEIATGRILKVSTAAEQGAISGKYKFSPGDVVYSKIRPYLKKAFLATFRGLCSADMYPLTPSLEVTADFLLTIILGEHYSRFAESLSERSGFPKINRSEMSEYVLALPDVDEQARITDVLRSATNLSDQLNSDLDKMRRVKTGLMQDLLTGRVSVTSLLANEDATYENNVAESLLTDSVSAA